MNCEEWIIRVDPRFELNVRQISGQRILSELDKEIERLRRNPDIGKNLGPRRPYLWEIYVDGRFRLYYEIRERKCVVYLKAFYPKNLQRGYLQGKIV